MNNAQTDRTKKLEAGILEALEIEKGRVCWGCANGDEEHCRHWPACQVVKVLFAALGDV